MKKMFFAICSFIWIQSASAQGISFNITPDSGCGTNCNGAIDLTVNGGTPPFSFAWPNGDTTQNLANLCAGTYAVSVTDANGWMLTNSAVVNNIPAIISITAATTQDTNCDSTQTPTACTGQKVVEWDANPCQVGSNNFWNGFSPAYPNSGGCANISATPLYRNQGGNSCAPGRPNGDGGFCSGDFRDTSWSSNHARAIRFEVNFGAADAGHLTGLNFWELATSPAVFANGAGSQNNNYPTSYGLRVLKNGVEIFLQANNSTSTTWSLESFDFSNDPAFAYNGVTTFKFELYAYSPVGNGFNSYIWDLDDISVNACCAADASEIYCEGFNYPNGTDSSANWSVDVSGANLADGGYFEVRNNKFAANDIDGTEAIWASSVIDISRHSNVNISVDLSSSGDLEANDYIHVYYSLDGGQEITLTNGLQSDNFSAITAIASGLNGSTLQIIIRTKNSMTDEYFYFDNVCLHGTAVCTGTGTASLTVSGGTPPYSFSWSTGGTDQNISSLCEGSYTVTATDANGCSSQTTVAIVCPGIDSCNLTLNAVVTAETCAGSEDGTVSCVVSGGTAPYVFSWSNGESASNISGLAPGDYLVTVTDSLGCIANGSFTIDSGASITLLIQLSNLISCNGGADGELCAAVAGGNAPLVFAWSNGDTTQCSTGLAAGAYDVTVTDANGCQSSETFILVEPAPIVITSTVTNADCSGLPDGSIDISVSGGNPPYAYVWSNGETTEDISSLTVGIYDIIITDADGCSSLPSSIVVSGSSGMSLAIASADVSCQGAADGLMCVQVSGGTSPFSYSWSNGDTTDCLDSLGVGSYSVTVTDSSGCVATSTGTVSEPDALSLSIVTTDISCFGGSDGSVVVTPSGGNPPYSYVWDFGGTDEQYIGTLGTGSVNVTVTDFNGCSTTGGETINQPDSLTIAINTTDVSCFSAADGSVVVVMSGGTSPYSYLWDFGGTDQQYIGIIEPGTGVVTVTDANGCSVTAAGTVTEPDPLALGAFAQPASCFGGNDGSIDLFVSGGVPSYTYAWTNGETDQNIIALNADNYTVIVTDANNCEATLIVPVQEPAEFNLTAVVTNVSTAGGNDGSIDLSVSGGTSPYSYLWSGGDTGEDIANLFAGDYFVTVTDSNGCSVVDSFAVADPFRIGAFKVNVNPNPFEDQFFVDITNDKKSKGSISLYDLFGKTLLNENLEIEKGQSRNLMNVDHLPAGLYLLQIKMENHITTIKVEKH